jgi:hypothetical protein
VISEVALALSPTCDVCALKPKCCPNTPARKIARSVHEAARDKVRAIAKTEAYVASRRERKKVEMPFAHLKRILGFGKLRLATRTRVLSGRIVLSPKRRLEPPIKIFFSPLSAALTAVARPQHFVIFACARRSRSKALDWARRELGSAAQPGVAKARPWGRRFLLRKPGVVALKRAPQKIFKAPLSAQLGIDETSSEALNGRTSS